MLYKVSSVKDPEFLCQEGPSPDFRLKFALEELMMTSQASLVMSPDDTSKVSWPICIWYTPREGDNT